MAPNTSWDRLRTYLSDERHSYPGSHHRRRSSALCDLAYLEQKHRDPNEESEPMKDHAPRYRAKTTEAGWKIERRIDGCGHCGSESRWQTLFYTYQPLDSHTAAVYAKMVAEMLNAQHDTR